MASEPSDDPVSVSLPPDLAEWVDQQAADRDTDRETILVQLLAAHQATAQLDGEADLDADVLARTTDLEDEVRDIIAGRLSDIAGAVADRIDVTQQVQTALDSRLDEDLDERVSAAVEAQLSDAIESELAGQLDERLAAASESAADQASQQVQREIEAVESEFTEKIQDVRDRVIQVKKETDRKAPAEHKHPDILDRINGIEADTDTLQDEIEVVSDDLGDLRADLESELDNQEERLDDLDETIWDIQEKLRTVAYVVKELRDGSDVGNKRATSVEQIKRAAAEYDVERAKCEACGQGVTIALMTGPECPHCDATVTSVEPKDGFFGSPRLIKAQGIEAASDTDEP
ncbi:MAG: hypothetical protein ABEI77_03600 [Halorientalis sp.]